MHERQAPTYTFAYVYSHRNPTYCHPTIITNCLCCVQEAKAAQKNLERLVEQAKQGGSSGDRHAPWGPSTERDSSNPELAAVLRKVWHLKALT